MREHEVFGTAVKAAADPVREILVRQVAQARQNSLLQLPRIIIAGLEHVATVVRLNHDSRAAAESFSDQRGDVAEVHHGCDLDALVSGSETEVVDCVVRNGEWMKIDLANFEVSARLDLLHSIVERLGAAAWLFATDVESFKIGRAHV